MKESNRQRQEGGSEEQNKVIKCWRGMGNREREGKMRGDEEGR